MEITVEQLQELIFEEEQIKEIAQKQSDQLDYDASVELMERVMNASPIQQLIAPAEAMELFRYAGIQEMRIAKDLHDFYRAQKERHSDSLWDMMSLLSFVYDTGRVQGMREERAKRKERYNG